MDKAKYKYWGMFEIQNPEAWQVQERMVWTIEHMQVPNMIRPGVRMKKRHLLASRQKDFPDQDVDMEFFCLKISPKLILAMFGAATSFGCVNQN